MPQNTLSPSMSFGDRLPGRIFNSFSRYSNHLKAMKGNDIAIQGGYYTTNVGDRSLGLCLRAFTIKSGISSDLYGRTEVNFERYQMVIEGGGGIIHDYYPNNLELRLHPLKSNPNVLYIGVGVPGIHTEKGKEIIKEIERARVITVRDSYSKRKLESLTNANILVTADPVWLFDNLLDHMIDDIKYQILINFFNVNFRKYLIKELPPRSKRKRIGLALAPRFDMKDSLAREYYDYKIQHVSLHKRQYIKNMRGFIRNNKEKLDMFFIPFFCYDIPFYIKYISDLGIGCLPLQNPVRTFSTLEQFDGIIAMHYHSVILSILADVPVFSVIYEQKVEEITREFKSISSTDLRDITDHWDVSFEITTRDYRAGKRKMKQRASKNYDIILEEYKKIVNKTV